MALSNCWLNLYDLPWFGGASTGYQGSRATLGRINNDTSSIRIS